MSYLKLLEFLRNPENEGAGGGGGTGGDGGGTGGTAGSTSSVVTGSAGTGGDGDAAAAAGQAGQAGGSTTGTGGTGGTGQVAQGAVSHPLGDDWLNTMFNAMPEAERTPKAKEYLGRRGSAADVIRSGMHADATISRLMSERVKIPTGQNDDPKDVAQYRKAVGVPEKADDYKFDPPREYNGGEWTDFDKELIGEARAELHNSDVSQKQLDTMQKIYWSIEQRRAAANLAQAARASQASLTKVNQAMGGEFTQRIEQINRTIGDLMAKYGADAEERTAFMSKRFADGTAVGENYAFVMALDEIARDRSDDGAFYMGNGTDGQDLNKRIDDAIAMSHTNPVEYAKIASPGGELERMIAVQNRRNASAARSQSR